MKYFVVLCLSGALLMGACGNHQQPADHPKQDSLSQTDSAKNLFFPVAEYLESEILHVDSIPMALRKYTTVNGKTDSAFIQLPEFNALSLQFLPEELHNGSFEKNFTENTFADKTTESITFNYSTEEKGLPLRRVDVQTIAGNSRQRVKSVYLEKHRVSGDSVIFERLYWRTGKSFQVSTSVTVKGKAPAERQLKVVWNNGEDE